MKITRHPNPILYAKNEPVGEINEEVQKKITRMFEILYEEDGVGLAAPQAEWNARVFITNVVKGRPKGSERIYINPEILEFFGDQIWLPEGCLSLPNVWGKVRRWTGVRVRAQNEKGETVEETLEGLAAQAIQHETDHLNGMLCYEKMSPADQRQNQPYIRELERRWRE